MLSKREIKRLMSEAQKEKARVHIGRDGVTQRVLRTMHDAFTGCPSHPGTRDVVRVKIHQSCTWDGTCIIEALREYLYIGEQKAGRGCFFMVFARIKGGKAC